VDTNHESHGHKPSRHATKSVTSPRQTRLCRSNGIWAVKMRGKSRQQSLRQSTWTNHESASWFVLRTFMICICDKIANFVAKSAQWNLSFITLQTVLNIHRT